MRALVLLLVAAIAACGSKPDPLEDIGIEVASQGDTGLWTVKVVNGRSTPIAVVWDASSYVGSKGASMGRLIRGETRKMDVGKPQAPSPVAPGSWIEETVVPEKLTELDAPPVSFDDAGTMHVAIEAGGRTVLWTGRGRAGAK